MKSKKVGERFFGFSAKTTRSDPDFETYSLSALNAHAADIIDYNIIYK